MKAQAERGDERRADRHPAALFSATCREVQREESKTSSGGTAVRTRTIVALFAAFGLGMAAGRGTGPSAAAQDKPQVDPYAEMLHVGVVVKDLDEAVANRKAMGFTVMRR